MTRSFAGIAFFSLIVPIACEGQLAVFDSVNASGAAGDNGTAAGGTGGSDVSGGGEGGEGTPDTLVIDDFEDGDPIALLQDGEWYVANDGTGLQTFAVEPPPDRPGSAFAAHTSGVGFETWGAIFGLDLAGSHAGFDASDYAALSFSARVQPGSTRSILFAFLVGSQHFAVPLELGTEWQVHTIPFSAALPSEQGPLSSFDPRAIAGIQFFVASDASFDFWLDDLAFVR